MILVTGAKGFLGAALLADLERAGHEVVGIDIEDGDLRDAKKVDHLLHDLAPRKVVHMAAQVGRQFCEDDAAHAIDANVKMTYNVASSCAKYGAELIYTSTSEVYGEHGDAVCDESVPLTGTPTGMYALTKRWSEDVARQYGPRGLKIFRPSMPYGPGAPPGRGRRALDNFLWQAHHRMPIKVHIGATRSWCYIDDATRAMRMVIEGDEVGPFNIGRDDAEVSMLALADMCCDLAGAPYSLIEQVLAPHGQTVVKRLSTERLRAIGWKPEIELDEGIQRVYDWIKNFDAEGNYVGTLQRRPDFNEVNA
jgi:nucleoside-diphosphate-sugar epimerase